jgi:hypothetical protein
VPRFFCAHQPIANRLSAAANLNRSMSCQSCVSRELSVDLLCVLRGCALSSDIGAIPKHDLSALMLPIPSFTITSEKSNKRVIDSRQSSVLNRKMTIDNLGKFDTLPAAGGLVTPTKRCHRSTDRGAKGDVFCTWIDRRKLTEKKEWRCSEETRSSNGATENRVGRS